MARALDRLGDPRVIKPLTDYPLARECRPDGFRAAVDALAQIRQSDSVLALVKVLLNTRNSLAGHYARQALADVAGVSFSIEPNETVAKWWELDREDSLRPIPEKV